MQSSPGAPRFGISFGSIPLPSCDRISASFDPSLAISSLFAKSSEFRAIKDQSATISIPLTFTFALIHLPSPISNVIQPSLFHY
jgi:hypothetical protein